jgi:hypothetical protein
MLMVERTVAFSSGFHDRRDEVHHMVYVILVIVVVVLFVIFFLARRKAVKRGFSYAPDSDSLGNKVYNPREIPKVAIPTPEFKTEEISHDEFQGDVSDDLLDPNNPKHAEWMKDHPEMEPDAEWVKEHPEDTPS